MTKLISPKDWKPKGVSDFETNASWAITYRQNALVSAGPGSGKTELLAQRAAYLLETGICPRPRKILAISFKNDAARNLRERVAKRIDAQLCWRFDSLTFDSFAKSLLDRFQGGVPKHFRPSESYNLEPGLDFKVSLNDWFVNIQGMAPELTRSAIATLGKSFYEKWVIGHKLNAEGYGSSSIESIAAGAMWDFQLKNRKPSTLNFPMIGRLADLILRQNSKIVSALRHTYAFVFLDEFQDTTQIQYDLTCTAFLGSDAVLTAVGDDKQRIMLWAGALPGVFDKFKSDFNATHKSLVLNWRSAPELIRIQHYLITAMDDTAVLPEVPECNKDKKGVCKLLVFQDEGHEAKHMAALIADLVNEDKIPPREIGILARQKVESFTKELQSELAAKQVKARVETDYQELLAEPAIDFILMFIQVASRRRCPEVWTKLSNDLANLQEVEEDSITARRLQKQTKEMSTALATRLCLPLSEEELLKEMVKIVKFVGVPELKNRYRQYQKGKYLQDLVKKCAKLLAANRESTEDWNEALSDFRGEQSVPILTIHKSKGLEYEAVIFLGLEDSALWNYQYNTAEEDCSFFVAFSRAKTKIFFTFANARLRKIQSHKLIQPLYDRMTSAGIKLENVQ